MSTVTQETFVEMCEIALEHWDFDAASEPYHSSKPGLEYMIEHPFTDEQLAEIEESQAPLMDEKGTFNWDWLQEMAVSYSGG